jgi:hypothetical protein
MEDGSLKQRYTVQEAADILGITPDGVRKRIHKDQLSYTKDSATGRYYVFLSPGDIERETSADQSRDDLLQALEERIASLERQLDKERDANSENRRLLAAALERIPAIEAPPDTPPSNTPSESQSAPVSHSDTGGNSDEVPPEEERRSWWRRLFEV